MFRARAIVQSLILSITFAAYGAGCEGALTPQQAACCCRSMRCSSEGRHGQDCCKRTSAKHDPFVQPSTEQYVFLNHVVVPVAIECFEAARPDFPARNVSAQCHAPPERHVPASPPIRI